MKKYRILLITDHSGHSAENSVYALTSALRLDARTQEIFIVSRGVGGNDAFFKTGNAESIKAVKLTSDLYFSPIGEQFKGPKTGLSPSQIDIVFLRLPRPVEDNFLINLKATFDSSVIVNDPEGIIKTSNKAYLLNFPKVCPKMALCQNEAEVKEFTSKGKSVLKPLRDYGGRGILKVDGGIVDNGRMETPFEEFFATHDFPPGGYLAMEFMENVDQGDKRILVVGGEIMASSLRLPRKGSWLCNVAQGGRSVPSEVDQDEVEIINHISPRLKEEGILIYGVDTLMGNHGKRILSEINTLSVGGFPQAQSQTGLPIIKLTIDKLFDYAAGLS
jgi:glutathione synthase